MRDTGIVGGASWCVLGSSGGHGDVCVCVHVRARGCVGGE